jgi:hypothetical protein
MHRSRKTFLSLNHLFVALATVIVSLCVQIQPSSADISVPPKGVSQELWKAYQEIVISNIDGADRNLRWNTNPVFYIAGDPTPGDNTVFQSTLFEIGSYCQNIKPFVTPMEPGEGALFYYTPVSKFKSIISSVPNDVTNSYAWSLYYLNRGLTKFTAVFSTEISQVERDYATRIRVLQGMGLRNKTSNVGARIFSWNFYNSTSVQASELDKQILRLYCSTYTRSWDSSQQTFDLISGAWIKKTAIPNLPLNIKVGEYKNQLNFGFNFDPSQALDNQVTGIQYYIYESSGSLHTSGKVDIVDNLFKTYEVVLKGIKDNSRYKIEAFPLNSIGNGYVSKGEGRAGNQVAPVDSVGLAAADASAESIDAKNAAIDAKDAAIEALAQYERFRAACDGISIDFEIEVQELYDSTNLNSNCALLNEKVSLLEKEISALDPEKSKTTDQANKLTDQANLLAEEADAFVAQIQDITDELVATEKQFSSLVSILKPLNNLETSVIAPWGSLQDRLSTLPSALVSSLKKSSNYKSASMLSLQVQTILKIRDTQVESLSTIDKPSQITSIINKLKLINTPIAQLTQFKKSLVAMNKLIPSNVCQKGSKIVLASKAGKCASGFALIPTS